MKDELEKLVGRADTDFESLETSVRMAALKLAARAIETRFNADTSDGDAYVIKCSCGNDARQMGRRKKTFETVLGPITLERAYYYCTVCKKGTCPRDRALGFDDSTMSPGVTRMIGTVGAVTSFKEGSELLRELAGVAVETKLVERMAEALGGQIEEYEVSQVEPLSEAEAPSTLYLGMDGTGIPMRPSELEGRAGKQPDGTAKTREVKLCVVWSAEGRDEAGIPTRDEGSVTYTAAIESAATRDIDRNSSEFAQRVQREANRRRFLEADRRVILGDGAAWIWNIADELFPDALQIVDRFHAKQHLSDVAKAIWGPESKMGKKWAEQRHHDLDKGRLSGIINAMRKHSETNPAARKCIEYIERNKERMRYHDFHARGLCTSTGVVEAGCKHAIGTRLKRSGMHWTVRGSNAIIALRCCKLSGRFEDFWEQRSRNICAA